MISSLEGYRDRQLVALTEAVDAELSSVRDRFNAQHAERVNVAIEDFKRTIEAQKVILRTEFDEGMKRLGKMKQEGNNSPGALVAFEATLKRGLESGLQRLKDSLSEFIKIVSRI